MTNTDNVGAQSADPSTLPLLSSGGLEYVGAFRVPAETVNGMTFSYGGQAVAYDPPTNSLFISNQNYVAEVSIPTPVNSSDVNALPFASFLQPFSDPAEGHLREVFDGDVKMDSLMVYGNRLYGTAYIYFDTGNVQRVSHYSRSRQLTQPSFSGWSQVWETGGTGFVAGMMATVPSEWQAKLGGPAITGQCCIPIIYRTSSGPSALAFDPSKVGQASVSATALLYYPQDHATLGSWSNVETINPSFNMGTEIFGMAVIASTRTVLYFGKSGMGKGCYGPGTGDQALVGTQPSYGGEPYCYDPTNSYKGAHAYPYRYQIWAYDLNDLAAVKAGAKQPWDVVPYGVWPLNLPTPASGVRLGGVGYDAQRQLLYVSQLRGDGDHPLIHTFRVNASAGAAPLAPVSTVSNVTLTSSKTAPQAPGSAITFTAHASGGAAPYQYKWLTSDGVATTVAANWTASNQFTWTPAAANSNYVVAVWVRSAGNTVDALEASTSFAFPIAPPTASAVTSVNLVANRVAPQPPLTAITWTATPVGGVAPHEYKWIVSDGVTTTVAANWSTTNSFVWTPSTGNANYRVEVWARSAGNTADAKEASGSSAFPIETATAFTPVSSVALSADKAEPQQPGTAIAWSATPSGGTAPFVYKWFVFDGTNWTMVYNWDAKATFGWTPTVANANYRVRVWVKSATYWADQPEATAERSFSITTSTPSPPPLVSSVALIADKAEPQQPGTAIAWSATPSGGTAPFVYKWFVFDGTNWTMVYNWDAKATFGWTPTVANANYRVRVWVKSATYWADQPEATAERGFSITTPTPSAPSPAPPAPVSSVALIADKPSPQAAGSAIGFTGKPSGGTSPYVYKWFVFDGANWTTIGGWTSNSNFTWSPASPSSNYRIRVWAKSAANTADQPEATAEQGFSITAGTTAVSAVQLTSDKSSPQGIGAPITFTATPSGGTAPFLYKWSVSGAAPLTTPWVAGNTFTWTPTTPDNNYRISVAVKRASSAADQAEATAEVRFNINPGNGNGKD